MTSSAKKRRHVGRLSPDARAEMLAELERLDRFANRHAGGGTRRGAEPSLAEIDMREGGDASLPKLFDLWGNLHSVSLDEAALARSLVISARRDHPSHTAFDILRTRLVQALSDRGWNRVAITAPSRGCGTSLIAANLSIALSRYQNCRSILLDMDLRAPGLSRYFGFAPRRGTGEALRGTLDPSDWLLTAAPNEMNIGRNLALGLNATAEDFSAELLQSSGTGKLLAQLDEELSPDIVLYDMPPALGQDDVIAFREHFDCVLIVVGGGITRASEVRETIRRIGEDRPVVGVVLNNGEGALDMI